MVPTEILQVSPRLMQIKDNAVWGKVEIVGPGPLATLRLYQDRDLTKNPLGYIFLCWTRTKDSWQPKRLNLTYLKTTHFITNNNLKI